MNLQHWEQQLDARRLSDRLAAVREIAQAVVTGRLPVAQPTPYMNLHCHTFFSYNAFGWSPSHIAWIARRDGWSMAGIVDFDVLDGLEEFQEAGRLLGVRTTVGIESRVFIDAYRDRVLNSPNEPGICYFMGVGIPAMPRIGTPAAKTLERLAAIARLRTQAIIDALNAYLHPVAIDFQRDLIPLTAMGNATERHILKAYHEKSVHTYPEERSLAGFWADRLGSDPGDVQAMLKDTVRLFELMRARLMKHGGVGYVQPDPKNYPSLDEFIAMVQECGGLPAYAYLDGTSDGESDIGALLHFFQERGVRVVNVIPDRNWNIKDPAEKASKVARLDAMIRACRELDLHVVAGTELNKQGQRLIDDFTAPELAKHLHAFVSGAEFVHSHAQSR
jgi:hypothetical protein